MQREIGVSQQILTELLSFRRERLPVSQLLSDRMPLITEASAATARTTGKGPLLQSGPVCRMI